MSSVFCDLSGRLSRQPLWLEFERYAAAVFAGQPGDWHTNAHRHADTLIQAQRLVRSDFVSIPVLDVWLEDGEWQAAVQGSLGQGLSQWEGQGAHQRFVAEVMDALFHRIGTQTLMAMRLPSPSSVLRRAGIASPYAFDDLDDVAAALTTVLRQHCERKFATLVICCDEATGLSDDEFEACEPLIGSARYYGWGTALRLDAVPEGAAVKHADGFDAVLLGHWSEAALQACAAGHVAGGLGEPFWREVFTAPQRHAMCYGEIPVDAMPERVAEHLKALQGLGS